MMVIGKTIHKLEKELKYGLMGLSIRANTLMATNT